MPKNNIQAIVLAGGFGTRLKPLTDSKPKPLVKVLDKSVMELVLNSVKKAGIKRITVSTFHKSNMIEKACCDFDKTIMCNKESIPLGTAGAVKNCYDGISDTILVLSGDAVFDFDLCRVVSFHEENGCDVTIASTHKENPTQLGNILCDNEGNIEYFCEKPSWKNVKTDVVNTGIYVIDKSIMEQIPDNVRYDFSKNLFPKLIKEGRKIKTITLDDYWCDIGTVDEYYLCNMSACNNEIDAVLNTSFNKNELLCKGINAEGKVYVSPSAEIGKNVKINASVVCKNAAICDNCDVESSVVGEKTYVGKGSSVCLAIVGENVSIGENCIVPDGCVIGDNVRISDGTRLKKYTRIAANSSVSREDKSTMDFSKNVNIFKSEATAVFDVNESNMSLALLAKALAVSKMINQSTPVSVAVMCNRESEFAKYAFVSGLQAVNTTIYDCGVGEVPCLRHAGNVSGTDASVYLYTENGLVCAEIYNEKTEKIDETDERKITKIYGGLMSDNEIKNVDCSYSKIAIFPSKQVYKTYLKNLCLNLLCGKMLDEIEVFTDNEILQSVLPMLNAKMHTASTPNTVNIEITNDYVKMRKTNLVLDTHHIIAVVLKNTEVLSNPLVKLGNDAPTILKNMLPKNHDNFDITVDLTDPYVAVLSLLCIMSLCDKTFEELCDTIPQFEIFIDDYLADVNRAATMEKLSRLYSDTKNNDTDGIRLQMADGNVTVVPNRAKGFKIVAEAVNMETAKELSFRIGEIIKNS